MTVTEAQIEALTPDDRIVWKERRSPRGVEMGLHLDDGDLVTDMKHVVRWKDGDMPEFVSERIVRILPRAFEPRRGLVIGDPDDVIARLVCLGPDTWVGRVEQGTHWYEDADAHNLIENHGWRVMDVLTREVTP